MRPFIRNQTNPDFCIKLLHCCEFFKPAREKKHKHRNQTTNKTKAENSVLMKDLFILSKT